MMKAHTYRKREECECVSEWERERLDQPKGCNRKICGESAHINFHYEIWMNALLHQQKFDAQFYYRKSKSAYARLLALSQKDSARWQSGSHSHLWHTYVWDSTIASNVFNKHDVHKYFANFTSQSVWLMGSNGRALCSNMNAGESSSSLSLCHYAR